MSRTNKAILEQANAAIGEITLKDEAGRATRHSYCDVWRFRDGKLAELHAFVVETG